MTMNHASRREFLRRASLIAGSVGPAGVPFAMNLAAMNTAAAQTADYKAIVCLFLYGGNDSANMVLPTDTASWNTYTTVRNTGTDPIALRAAGTAPDAAAAAASPAALGGVLPVVPNFTAFAENNARTFALHPSMTEMQSLFGQARLGIIANAGPLVQPMTKAEYQSNTTKKRPAKLFSHNDQQSMWQALGPEGARIGWGGRFGDLVAGGNTNTVFTSISAGGNAVFMTGQNVFQYQVGSNGATAIGNLTGTLFGSAAAATNYRNIITQTNATHLMAREQSVITKRSIDAQAVFQTAYAASTVAAPTQYMRPSTRTLANNDLAVQLQTVTRIIGARAGLGATRQVFFVSMGGFDTHDNQNRGQADLMARLSHAIGYFDTALAAIGMRDKVALFTGSDFGRTFTTNGDGTDHGWGAHHFVYGGAVKGKEIYGRFPQVGLSQPDEVGSGSFLPGVSVDQIGATLGKWFGVSDADLNIVFPNLKNFNANLGFI
ncbi:DUF1501 domain-containing protein [Piscinibacter gummiphilus]|uniref:Uncharacterized protein n=1 Tax=Piscinibacter gummiphilus TaxID=946333 RepID=A0A1W6LGJ6_9BURK|nr:DUF1501 domain-containing protein [Piscinibacter gummiphilus]ARN23404.1 hypothetical protein A4W93_27835 [Piscinibacter gummiphilus]ATU68111.1 DUF1501 domain-containing protein [Piscinibacter gummiphilus]GLS97419.1 hypothetical protein GCM10007918_47110 [Piscinibacter gummiphilus]